MATRPVFSSDAAAPPPLRRLQWSGQNKVGFYARRIFPRMMDRLMSGEEIEAIRSRVLENVGGHVLEVGFGTGLNLFHYPETVTSLTAIDPNPGMNQIARGRIRRARFPVDLREADCLNLPMVPETFDCAVSTFTLCSIDEVETAAKEIFNVLKFGGRFHFVEHGLSDAPGVAKWQSRLTPIQRCVADGCHLNRDIQSIIERAGFSIRSLERYNVPGIPKIAGHFYEGVAIKAPQE